MLVLGGVAAYLVLRSIPSTPAPVIPAVSIPEAPPPSVNTAPEPPVNIPEPVEPVPEAPPPPPPAPDRDTDGDGLTDAEEVLFGTNAQIMDTDGDGYADGTEVANLYNPVGIAPQRLIDTDLVFEYTHPIDGWSVYVPRQWAIAATDQEQREIIVTTQVSGESLNVTNQAIIPIVPLCTGFPEMLTKRGATGCRGLERPIAFFVLPQGGTLAIEHRATIPPARFPMLFEMILQSFAFSGTR